MNLHNLSDLTVYPQSIVDQDGTTYFLAHFGGELAKQLGIIGDSAGFDGFVHNPSGALLCPLSAQNCTLLRERLPWSNPSPLGLKTSAGFGDRLGLATPGHVLALQAALKKASAPADVAPIFAQQSVRENARTGRTPQQVMDDAIWGVFESGWQGNWGADADHLKTFADADEFAAAGFTFFTVDPGDHVDNEAHEASVAVLKDKLAVLPWKDLEDSREALYARYLGQAYEVETVSLSFDEEHLLRAACKYDSAIRHAAFMYRHLVDSMADRPFELEVSVDETATPTSPLEHYFIASELRRLGVRWVSLAPRYVGRFEKGVDYIGDLGEFEKAITQHAAIAREFGPYKLSIHSGSDKFTIYPIISRHTKGLVHLKTAGTSYLEALRAIADVDPVLFRQIFAFSMDRYEVDRASYHVPGDLSKVPAADDLTDAQLGTVLDQFDGRQVLHVTFGSVLDRFGDQLKLALARNEAAHYEALRKHFIKHIAPLV